MTYLDEVHAVGLYGPRGAGIAERDGVDAPHRRSSKPRSPRDSAWSAAMLPAPQRWSTSSAALPRASSSPARLPPAVAAGAVASIRHVKQAHELRERHQERAARLKRRLAEAGLPVMPSASHIVPVFVGDAAFARRRRTICSSATRFMCSRSIIRPCLVAPSGFVLRRRRNIATPISSIWSAALSDVFARLAIRRVA